MCSRKNKREVVFAKRRISTAYSLAAVITVSLGLAKDWFANNSSRYFRAIRQTISLRKGYHSLHRLY